MCWIQMIGINLREFFDVSYLDSNRYYWIIEKSYTGNKNIAEPGSERNQLW
jgi:hypothetical protein